MGREVDPRTGRRVVTAFSLPTDVNTALRARAVQEGRPYSRLVEDILRRSLMGSSPPPAIAVEAQKP